MPEFSLDLIIYIGGFAMIDVANVSSIAVYCLTNFFPFTKDMPHMVKIAVSLRFEKENDH